MTRSLILAAVVTLSGCFDSNDAAPTDVTQNAVSAPMVGPQGPRGPVGPAGRDAAIVLVSLPTGDGTCAFGGTKFIAADVVSFACNGDPGMSRMYGDGSSGALQVTESTDWTDAAQSPGNLQFDTLVIEAGETLTVPSGTVLRSKGAVTIRGTLIVASGVPGPAKPQPPTPGSALSYQAIPAAGVASGPAIPGEIGDETFARNGGTGGTTALTAAVVKGMVRSGPVGGGAGAGSLESAGCAGGGSVTILGGGTIYIDNAARISADGVGCEAGAGGGAGGVVVLASHEAVVVTGHVSARGGNGGDSGVSVGAGGGGGGGIVHALAPRISIYSPFDVSGGMQGSYGANVSGAVRGGGSGGGASGGNGGAGALVMGPAPSTGTGRLTPLPTLDTGAMAGARGIAVTTVLDPASAY